MRQSHQSGLLFRSEQRQLCCRSAKSFYSIGDVKLQGRLRLPATFETAAYFYEIVIARARQLSRLSEQDAKKPHELPHAALAQSIVLL
jgi:hypothetical protein